MDFFYQHSYCVTHSSLTLHTGLVHGLIHAKVFFLLFVNDYPKCLKYSNVTIYADDTSQDITDKSVDIMETKLICDLKSSMNWMNENKLTMNLKKTQCMLVGTKQRLSKCRKNNIRNENVILETVEVSKLLGVNINCCLTWSNHLEILANKISKKLGVLKRLKPLMSGDALLKVYSCIIFPHFNYCNTVWSGAKSSSNIDRLLKLKKKQVV